MSILLSAGEWKRTIAVIRAAKRYVKERRKWETDPGTTGLEAGKAADRLGEAVDRFSAEVVWKDGLDELSELKEMIAPFILHGKALNALKRKDITKVISKKGSSYLCLGAFKMLMETVDPMEFGLEVPKGRSI
jgi:hypothetical protein